MVVVHYNLNVQMCFLFLISVLLPAGEAVTFTEEKSCGITYLVMFCLSNFLLVPLI